MKTPSRSRSAAMVSSPAFPPDAHGNMVRPGKGPGIAFKFLVKLHAQQFARDGQVITEGQHEIARKKIFCQTSAAAGCARPPPTPQNPHDRFLRGLRFPSRRPFAAAPRSGQATISAPASSARRRSN